MDAHEAPLIGSILRYIEENSLMSLPNFLWRVARDVVFPMLLGLVALGGAASVLERFWHAIIPLPANDGYRQAKKLYRLGQRKEALEQWTSLRKFGPAYLSRATHALYVEFDPQEALGVLRVAKEQQVRIQLMQVEMIKLDAQALQAGGNVSMIDMNARLAKQEHLGVSTA
jgi:hypothetical protein